jgi:queuine tRNA-ribosyltransferase
VGEPTAARLVSVHNVAWTLDLMSRARRAVLEHRYDAFRTEVLSVWG